MKGSYILILQLEHPLVGLEVGRLGQIDFAAGFYLYVGSAFGPGGLEARLAYHLRRHKARPHWHIDYLRAKARLREAWTVAGPGRIECVWCKSLRENPTVSAPAPGFGASDTGCTSHLFFLPHAPRTSLLVGTMLGAVADYPGEVLLEVHSFDEGVRVGQDY